jgi:hypothetical protein
MLHCKKRQSHRQRRAHMEVRDDCRHAAEEKAMFEFLRERLLRRRLFERIRNELSQHTQGQLHDLHIGPGDIDAIAWRGSYGPLAPERGSLRAALAAREEKQPRS